MNDIGHNVKNSITKISEVHYKRIRFKVRHNLTNTKRLCRRTDTIGNFRIYNLSFIAFSALWDKPCNIDCGVIRTARGRRSQVNADQSYFSGKLWHTIPLLSRSDFFRTLWIKRLLQNTRFIKIVIRKECVFINAIGYILIFALEGYQVRTFPFRCNFTRRLNTMFQTCQIVKCHEHSAILGLNASLIAVYTNYNLLKRIRKPPIYFQSSRTNRNHFRFFCYMAVLR